MPDLLQRGYRWQYSFTGEPVLVDENGNPVEQYETFDPTGWGGQGNNMLENGYRVFGTDGASRDAKRYERMAGQAENAPVIDQMHADAARQYGTDAIMELGKTASGTTPTQAVLLGRRNTQNAINNQTSMANTVRGGAGARAAAGRAAQMNAASLGATGRLQEEATRASEMATARNALMDATTKQRGQDIGVATEQAKLEAQQRAANAQREQYYERLGWETKNAQLGAKLGRTAAEQANANANAAQGLKEDQAAWGRMKDTASAVAGGVQGGLSAYQASQSSSDPDPNKTGSDERMKTNISPLMRKLTAPGYAPDGSGSATLPLMDAGDRLLQQSTDGRGFYAEAEPTSGPSLAAARAAADPAPPKPTGKINKAGKPKTRRITDEEMIRWAQSEIDRIEREKTAALAQGPAVRDTTFSDEKTKKPAKKKTQQEIDDEEAAAFFGTDKPVVTFGKQTKEDLDKAEYEKREGERLQRKSAEEAAEKNRLAREAAAEAAYQRDRGTFGIGPVLAWVRKTSGHYDPARQDDPERQEKARAFRAWLTEQQKKADEFARPLAPEFAKDALRVLPQPDRYADGSPRPGVTNRLGAGAWDESPRDRGPVERPLPREARGASVEGAKREKSEARGKLPEVYQANRRSYRDEDGSPLSEADAVKRNGPKPKKGNPKAEAEAMMLGFDASMIRGPSVRDTTTSDERSKNIRDSSPMAAANRSMAPSMYEYKLGFTPPTQAPGETNVGPMANTMARNEIARTAIVEDPESGLLSIDKEKGLKLAMGGVADLQRQIDDIKRRKRA